MKTWMVVNENSEVYEYCDSEKDARLAATRAVVDNERNYFVARVVAYYKERVGVDVEEIS